MKAHRKTTAQLSIISECQRNLFAFASFLNPYMVYGNIHQEVFSFLSRQDSERQLLLLPRGHLKSHCLATYCVWRITYNPWTTFVYLSSQEDLAKAQLYVIKSMMTSDRYKLYWPEMFSEESKEGTWSAYAFDVDHPERRERGIRDHTMIVKTVKSNAQGLHSDELVFDDVVVPQFADTQAGRSELSRSLGYFSSILNPGGTIKAAGTRYHPEDGYASMIAAEVPVWDDEQQEYTGTKPLWNVMERVVEDSPDRSGLGRYLWPRTESPNDGKKYGFDINELAKIKADYMSHQGLTHFYAQYYNDPNDIGSSRLDRSKLQYGDPKYLTFNNGGVHYKGKKLNVTCAMDVAWSDNNLSDYTAIAVVGADPDGFIYILDLDRFKTTKFNVYYDAAVALQSKWGFRRMKVESNAGGKLVAQEIESLVRKNGGSLVIDTQHSTSQMGKKQERWAAILEPRYESKSVYHFKGGLVQVYEEELMSPRPRHDDLKDAVCMAIELAKAPSNNKRLTLRQDTEEEDSKVIYLNKRFGGRMRIR